MPLSPDIQPLFEEVAYYAEDFLDETGIKVESLADGSLNTFALPDHLRTLFPQLPEGAEYRIKEARSTQFHGLPGSTFARMLAAIAPDKTVLSADFSRTFSFAGATENQYAAMHELRIAKSTYQGSVKTKYSDFMLKNPESIYSVQVNSAYDIHIAPTAVYRFLPSRAALFKLHPRDQLRSPLVPVAPDELPEQLRGLSRLLQRFIDT